MIYNFKYLRPFPPRYSVYPPYSDINQYMEHYFFNFYKNNIDRFEKIDRQYLPIFWTTLYNDGIAVDTQQYLNNLDWNKKYFTINQHDDGVKFAIPPDTIVFSASENGNGTIVPIPLITSQVPNIGNFLQKDILCSFVGTLTHPCRNKLYEIYGNHEEFYFSESRAWASSVDQKHFDEFCNITTRSKFSLCPRGNIIQSFRIYEVLQLNSVPVIVSDNFTYPFKDFINWKEFSIVININDINQIDTILKSITEEEYKDLSKKGQQVYKQYFTLDTMCATIQNMLSNFN